MKKILLSLTSGLLLLMANSVSAQYYTISVTGENPNKLNSDGENPAPLLTGWNTLWTGDATAAAAYSPTTALPFPFTFNGSIFTHFKASSSGSVTFDTASTILPPYGNTTLPSATVANNSVNILGVKPSSWVSGTTTYKSTIVTKTYGTAPNRQFWIQYNFFSEANISAGWTYWSVVLEETTNIVYIVDMKTLCLNGSSLCTNNVKMSAGMQINATTAYSVTGSPNLGANNSTVNKFTADDNKYYQFVSGTQPSLDLSVNALNNDGFGVNKPGKIYGGLRNFGKTAITSFTLNYQVDAGPIVSSAITNVNIAASGGVYMYEHPTPVIIATAGTHSIKVWATLLNGSADEVTTNDAIIKTVTVAENLRVTLHEVFTSSTCGPCTAGNANYKAVVEGRDKNLFAAVKYQQDFPGTGDPYSTTESVARRGYYSINSIPRMEIDGQWDANAQSFTSSLFSQFQTNATTFAIDATYRVIGKQIDINVKLKSGITLPDGYKLYVAIVEGKTVKNIKSNGETEFFDVMKKMLPDQSGTALVGGLTANTEKTMNFTYAFPGEYRLAANGQSPINLNSENSIEEWSDVNVVVFVQGADKRVLQAANAERTAFYNIGLNEVNSQLETAIYPNPTSNSFFVSSPKSGRAGMLRVFDMSGKEVVASQMVEFNKTEINCASLNKGIYFVEITAEGQSVVQKLVIAK